MASKKFPHLNKAALLWTGAVVLVLAALMGGAVFAAAGYGRLYEGRIFPGVRVLDVRLDGLTELEAREAVYNAVDAALRDGIRFHFDPTQGGESREVTLGAVNDPDAGRDLVRYDIESAVTAAATYGRSGNPILDSISRWRARIRPVRMNAGIVIDEERVAQGLADALDDVLPDVRDATLDVSWDNATKRANIAVVPEQAGRVLDADVAMRALRQQAEALRFEPIPVRDRAFNPTILVADAERLTDRVPELLAHAPFMLQDDGVEVEVDAAILASWLGVTKENGRATLTILPDRFADGIRKLLPDVEQDAKQGSLVIEDGKIKNFEAGTEGVAIDDATTRDRLLAAWAKNEAGPYPLVITRIPPALSGQDPERLGIKEIIGIGRSNFSGSPTNRRRNIANGVSKINGTLIPPGEEFSLLKILGPFEPGYGWLPELVIKGNETVPELGGGLCQIGTTTFRAALASGLPITQRRNHSYRVRYYEPVGTDATIYDPAPDFRFLNDTKAHVLIHAFIQGDNLIYEFWGTEDGRSTLFKGQTDVTMVDDLRPRIFNQTSPPPMKLVETLDLPPGEKKCTEVAHAGADAEFTYVVTYPDGSQKEEAFRSHYRPWQAVCLIGVEKLSEPPATDGSTPDAVPLDPDVPVAENNVVTP